VILRALQTYGAIVADNGASGFIGGVPDPRWNNDDLHQLGRVTLADFEAVDEGGLRVSSDSAAYRGAQVRRPAARAPARRPTASTSQVLIPHRPMSAEPAVVAGSAGSPGAGAESSAASSRTAARGAATQGAPLMLPVAVGGLILLALVLLVRARSAASRSRRPGRHARPRRLHPRHERSGARPARVSGRRFARR
jgi:hypothetical protein